MRSKFVNGGLAVAACLGVASLLLVDQPDAEAQTRGRQSPGLEASITGADSFKSYCASCHGLSAKGNGPIASRLRVDPPDLTTLARRNDGRFPSDRVRGFIDGSGRELQAHGPSDMPVWGPIFRAFDPLDARVRQRIDNLVKYLESIQAPSTGANDTGSQLFRSHCSSCHGATGQGNGPIAEHLRQKPADLTTFTTRNGGTFPRERVYRIIDGRGVPSHGDGDMPVWGEVFKRGTSGAGAGTVESRIEAIVRYLEGIQRRPA